HYREQRFPWVAHCWGRDPIRSLSQEFQGGDQMTKTLTKILCMAATLIVALPAAQALAAPKAKAQFSQSAYAVAENGGSATITVVRPRSGKSTTRLHQSMTVHYATIGGTAHAGVD